MAIAALSTQNFVAATEHLARYKKLTAPEEILSELREDEFSVSFRWLLAVDAEPKVLTDYWFAWMVSLARHGTGTRLNPVRVDYLQERTNLRALERHFGCSVKGGAARNEIHFRCSDATAPFVTRNADLFDILAPQFEEQLKRYTDEDSFIELVRRAIQDKLTGHRPSIETVSQALHVSPRTLQRRLQESGSSYQRVLDEARHAMARYYLSNSALELNEAAYLLGFEDPNSFGRAFRSWEGIPPSPDIPQVVDNHALITRILLISLLSFRSRLAINNSCPSISQVVKNIRWSPRISCSPTACNLCVLPLPGFPNTGTFSVRSRCTARQTGGRHDKGLK